ncbi:MAG: hypothetical protein M0T80_02580 [Actinomycetota bacterium]|nr:hypothetical protein [Actinomycetota bacterium]
MPEGRSLTIAIPAEDADATLIVAQRTNRLKGYRIGMHADVAKALRKAAANTVAAIEARTAVTFAADIDYDPTVQYLEVPAALLTVAQPPTGADNAARSHAQPSATVETDPEAHAVIHQGSSLPLLKAGELGRRTFAFYALLVGNTPETRTAFVTQWNPHRLGLSGKILTAFGDQLRRIGQPLLAFESLFHMAVTADGIAVLNKSAFEKVFRDVETMRARVPVWAAHVEAALPLDDTSLGCLADVCVKNMRVAAKARSLFESGVLKDRTITAAMLAGEMRRQDLDADRMVKHDKLVIEEADVPTLLKLLDEGLWRGWLTETAWEAGSKVKRGP